MPRCARFYKKQRSWWYTCLYSQYFCFVTIAFRNKKTSWWCVYSQYRVVTLARRKCFVLYEHLFSFWLLVALLVSSFKSVAIGPHYHSNTVCSSVLGWCTQKCMWVFLDFFFFFSLGPFRIRRKCWSGKHKDNPAHVFWPLNSIQFFPWPRKQPSFIQH